MGVNNPLGNYTNPVKVDNWFVMNITATPSVINQTQNITINYTFTLNGIQTNESMQIPYFNAIIDLISSNKTIDARQSQSFQTQINETGLLVLTAAADHAIESTTFYSIPTPPTPEPDNNDTDNNNDTDDNYNNINKPTNNPPTTQAIMKNTGIPLIIILVTLSILGILFSRKQN